MSEGFAPPMAASGAGQGSFYHHFPSKLDLAAAALEKAKRGGSLGCRVDTSALAATLIEVVQGGYVMSRAVRDRGS